MTSKRDRTPITLEEGAKEWGIAYSTVQQTHTKYDWTTRYRAPVWNEERQRYFSRYVVERWEFDEWRRAVAKSHAAGRKLGSERGAITRSMRAKKRYRCGRSVGGGQLCHKEATFEHSAAGKMCGDCKRSASIILGDTGWRKL